MTQEDKELLLKDLYGRLLYGVKCKIENIENCYTLTNININNFGNISLSFFIYEHKGRKNEYVAELIQVKPYLRPMSSMTEEEEKEFNDQIYKAKPYSDGKSYNIYEVTGLNIDWLNAHHFDYRGLIEKGLAIEAPEGMYN